LLTAPPIVAAEELVAPRIAVVVGEKSFITHVSVDDLRELYLRRTRLWPNGTRAIPINLPPDNPVRERFSQLVLGRAREDLVSYWNARYFEGITPPVVLLSAKAIRNYLAVEPAAIAYVPAEEVDETCRTLLVLEPASVSLPSTEAR
jgi:hypothetical protein